MIQNLLELEDKVKCKVLFGMMGWKVEHRSPVIDHNGDYISSDLVSWSGDENERWVNLYEPNNMAVFWRVLNWVCDMAIYIKPRHKGQEWFDMINGFMRWGTSPADVFIRDILDGILGLADKQEMIVPLFQKTKTVQILVPPKE